MSREETINSVLKTVEIILLILVFIFLFILLKTVFDHANDLIDEAIGFDQMKLAYDSAVVNTFVGPFEKIVGAFVVYAFGKLGFKVADNRNRMKQGKPPQKISFLN